MSDYMDGLDAPDARRWEFEDEGDTLAGEVLALGEYTGEYGTSRTITVMPDVENTTEAGQKVQAGEPLIFYASAKIAADELEAKDPRVGDEFAIRYKGDKDTKDGKNSYKVFKAAVKRNSAATELDRADAAEPAAAEKKADW